MLPWVYESRRKAIHLMNLIFPIAYHLGFSRELLTSILTALLVGILAVELLRIDFRINVPLLPLFRRRERGLSGATFMFVGMILAITAFPKAIAITVMAMTILGDSASALIGKTIGKFAVWGPRNIEGISAELIINSIVGILIFNNYGLFWPIALMGAVVATVIETVSYRVDDNLIVPLFAGIAMKLFIP
jgi:dolichol kinase